LKPVIAALPGCGGTQECSWRDAHRDPVRVVLGQPVGDLLRSSPTGAGGHDVTVDRPCSRVHLPGEGGGQVSRGFGVLGNQCRVLVDGSMGLDGAGPATMQCGAIRLQF
jgi:hypothetical protein